MTHDRRRRWVLGALLMAAGVGNGWRVPMAGAAGTATAEPSAVFRYDAHGHRDPFEPLVSPSGEPRTPRSGGATGSIHVEGVMWDAARPLAIVNGEVHRVGDEVEGYRVTAIRPGSIVVMGADNESMVVSVMVEGAWSGAP